MKKVSQALKYSQGYLFIGGRLNGQFIEVPAGQVAVIEEESPDQVYSKLELVKGSSVRAFVLRGIDKDEMMWDLFDSYRKVVSAPSTSPRIKVIQTSNQDFQEVLNAWSNEEEPEEQEEV